MTQLKPYKKELAYSYTLGVFPTIELLLNKPTEVIKVIIDPKSETNTGIEKIKELCAKNNINIETDKILVQKLSHKENTYVVGVFNKYENTLTQNETHVVLVNPKDMGNMGTITRTMVGFGVTNLAIIKPATDIFDPKVIRSSMGALFQINFEFFSNFEEYTKKHGNKLYLFTGQAQEKLGTIKIEKPSALVFGSENEGLSSNILALGKQIAIPQNTKIDSLNLAISVGIVLYVVT